MGITKTEIFTTKQNKLANILKALAHPARIATISQHLNELKNIGIIKGCVEGTSISYCIDEKVWKQVKNEFDSFLVSFQAKENCS
jgi:predicted transcriptional regulator